MMKPAILNNKIFAIVTATGENLLTAICTAAKSVVFLTGSASQSASERMRIRAEAMQE